MQQDFINLKTELDYLQNFMTNNIESYIIIGLLIAAKIFCFSCLFYRFRKYDFTSLKIVIAIMIIAIVAGFFATKTRHLLKNEYEQRFEELAKKTYTKETIDGGCDYFLNNRYNENENICFNRVRISIVDKVKANNKNKSFDSLNKYSFNHHFGNREYRVVVFENLSNQQIANIVDYYDKQNTILMSLVSLKEINTVIVYAEVKRNDSDLMNRKGIEKFENLSLEEL